MADSTESKKYLINIESNLDQYAKEADAAARRVAELKVANEQLRQSGEASGEEIERSNAALRTAQKEYANAKKSVDLATLANKAQSGSYEQLYRQWQLAQTQLKLMGSAYTVDANGVRTLSQKYIENKKAVEDAKRALDAFGKGVADNRLNVGNYSEAIQGAVGGLQQMPGPLGAAAGGMQRMVVAAKAFIATPIGAVVAAIAAAVGILTSYFKRSEEGQNALTKVTRVLGSVLENILDIVDKVGKAIFELFTKPKESIQKLGEIIQTNISNRLQALKDIAGAVGKIFSKDWKEGFKELGESTIQLVTGVDDLVGKVGEGIKNFGKELKDDAALTRQLADQVAALRQRERQELINDAKIRKQVAEIRAEAEKLKFIDAEKSIELTKRAFAIEREELKEQLEIAKIKRDNAALSASLSNSNIETLDEVARLEADVFAKQAAFDEARRQELRNLNKLKKEAFNQEKEQLTALLEIEKSKTESIILNNELVAENDLYTYDQRIQALKDNLLLRDEILTKQADLERNSIAKDLELETISQENANIKLLALDEKLRSQKLVNAANFTDESKTLIDELATYESERMLADETNRLAIFEAQAQNEFEVQRRNLDIKRQQELTAAEKNGADVNLIYEKYALARSLIDRAEAESRMMIYSDFAGSIATLFGEQTAIGRIAAVAQATINTYLAATQALAAYPPPFNYIAMASVILTGIAQVKKILTVKSGLPGDSGGGGSAPTAIAASAPAVRAYAGAVGSSVLNTPQLNQQQINALPNQNILTAADLAAAFSKMPAPVVTVEDINARSDAVKKVEVRGTI